ncbi:MAG: gamma-glutamylcyclotransferase [Balneolaceae bacterium]|nr:gamma-glutamylcyclotransferase [Balneolaceae bacterium]
MSERAQDFLFVYGSLQRGAHHRAHQMLRDYAEFVCRAKFDGELYLVKEYPGVVETKSPKSCERRGIPAQKS